MRTTQVLAELASQGFIKFPVAGAYVGNFLKEAASEYTRLRNENPDAGKFETLKTAIETARKTTSNVLLNVTTAPSAQITVVNEAESFFGKRSINKYLEKLA